MEEAFIPTELKIQTINALSAAGLSKIEVTSFVNPKVIPQMSDADRVMGSILRKSGTIYTSLVPNAQGAQRAIQAGSDTICVVVCVTESYNQRNVRMSITESLQSCGVILDMARANGVAAQVILTASFGCPLEGEVSESKVVGLAKELAGMGFSEISIADTIGLANPVQVHRRMCQLQEELPEVHFSLHLHNTRGLGLANVLAGLQAGIDTFDSSFAGLGGCPVVSGCTGNICTEDLVHMLSEMGIETGIDTEGLLIASRLLQDFLKRPLPSFVLRAGTRKQLYQRIAAREATSMRRA
jgi:hydroxymethylglutaryl-CoA lyase